MWLLFSMYTVDMQGVTNDTLLSISETGKFSYL